MRKLFIIWLIARWLPAYHLVKKRKEKVEKKEEVGNGKYNCRV